MLVVVLYTTGDLALIYEDIVKAREAYYEKRYNAQKKKWRTGFGRVPFPVRKKSWPGYTVPFPVRKSR